MLSSGYRFTLFVLFNTLAAPGLWAGDRAPPSKEAQVHVMKELESTFSLSKATKPEEKRDLAKGLRTSALAAMKGTTEEFVLWVQIARLATGGGDLALAREAIEKLDGGYAVDRAAMLDYAVEQSLSLTLPLPERVALLRELMDIVDRELERDALPSAQAFSARAAQGAARAGDRELVKAVGAQRQRVTALMSERKSLEPHFQTLQTAPLDPAANLKIGSYFCFRRRDFAKGLPMLARGSDKLLADLATAELAQPKTADIQLALADGWWTASDKAQKEDQPALRAHAGEIYRRAEPSLTGVAQVRAKHRLLEVQIEANGGRIYADDLKFAESSVGSGSLGIKGSAGYALGHGSEDVIYHGEKVKHSISTHPPSNGKPAFVEFDVPVNCDSFQAVAFLADEPQFSQVIFRVYGDGRPLWQSAKLRAQGAEQLCQVNIANVKRVRLEVVCSEAHNKAHAIWVNPQLVVKSAKK